MSQNERFYFKQTEPNKSCLLTLRDILLKVDEEVIETKKYGMPCFCYKNKMFAYLWMDKKTNEPYILFVEGQNLDHPNLETGNRARMKIFRINPNQDIPITKIELLLNKALDLYKSGKIKTK